MQIVVSNSKLYLSGIEIIAAGGIASGRAIAPNCTLVELK